MKFLELTVLIGLTLLTCGCDDTKSKKSEGPDLAALRRKEVADAKNTERALVAAKEEAEMLRGENRRLEMEVSRLNGALTLAERKIETARHLGKAEANLDALSKPKYTPPVVRANVASQPSVAPQKTGHPYWSTYQGVGILKGIRAEAERKWGTDYTMVEYSVKEQKEAFETLLEYRKKYDRVTKGIVAEAESHWGADYTMVVYRIKEQLEAKSRLDGN